MTWMRIYQFRTTSIVYEKAFHIYSQIKTPRRFLMNDLHHESLKEASETRAFTRTQTAFGRLQGSPMSIDSDFDLSPEPAPKRYLHNYV